MTQTLVFWVDDWDMPVLRALSRFVQFILMAIGCLAICVIVIVNTSARPTVPFTAAPAITATHTAPPLLTVAMKSGAGVFTDAEMANAEGPGPYFGVQHEVYPGNYVQLSTHEQMAQFAGARYQSDYVWVTVIDGPSRGLTGWVSRSAIN